MGPFRIDVAEAGQDDLRARLTGPALPMTCPGPAEITRLYARPSVKSHPSR
jgi:hypothetical protein